MNENLHIRAQKFFAQSLVEGLAQADQSWLDQHLRECADCAREAACTHELLHALRNIPVSVPRDLAARTQLRVRRAHDLGSDPGRRGRRMPGPVRTFGGPERSFRSGSSPLGRGKPPLPRGSCSRHACSKSATSSNSFSHWYACIERAASMGLRSITMILALALCAII